MLQTATAPTAATETSPLPDGWYSCRRCGEPTTDLSYAGGICEDCAGGSFCRPHYCADYADD